VKKLILAAVLALSGCGPYVYPTTETPTAVTICQNPFQPQQTVADMATRHCAAYGLVPRLSYRGACRGNYIESHYECTRGP
jgi:predicted lipoprotein